MSGKRYTLAEANDLLAYLAPTLVELRQKSEQAASQQSTVDKTASGNGGSAAGERWSRTLARIAELLERLEEWTVILRDMDSGLVDFPAEVHGKQAYFCWRLGEPKVAHYHSAEDGFAGRRPLPESF